MEDYDKFVQHRLSYLRKSAAEHKKPSHASSVICFYGQPILPPLLSGEKQEEMRRHRDAAQRASVRRKLKDNAKMAYVQTILQSVQLRKTPTLEELLQESEVSTRSSNCHKASDGSVSHSSYFTGTADNILFPPLPEWKEKDGASLPPLTSTTYSAFFASNVTPQQKYQEGCLNNQHTSQQGSPLNSQNGVSHQSASSGYVTYENVENTPSVSGRIESGRASLGFSSSEGACNAGGFFLHSTSNTIAKMPDIISHPPIDGEELEKSGVESSLCQDLLVGKDLSCSSLQLDSIMCDHSPAERCESSHVDGTEPKDCLPVTAEVDLKEGHGLDRNSDFSGSPEFSHPSAHHCPATEPHIQHEPTDPESADSHVDEAEPSVEPYRLSLQALLKKSQEYRRRQRMLRNQAKNTKIQERTQEQARQSADERSLSDKENEELPQKGTVTAEGTKPREGRDVFILSGEPKKSWESQRMVESRCFGEKTNLKSGSTHLIGDGNMKEKTVAQEETAFKNNKLNISLDVITEPKQISALPPQQLVLTETSSAQGALDSTACPTSFHRGAGKYHTIPAPSFCRSPIHCKSSIQDGEAAERAEASKRKILVGAKLDKHPKVEGGKSEQPDGLGAGPSDVGRAETKVSAASSQHIDQLESNLSGLKALISDLEATLTENLSSHSQAGGDVPREFSFEQKNEREHARLRRSDEDYLQGKLGGGADDSEGNTRSPGTQSSRDLGNVHEDTGLEQSVSDLDSLPLPVEVPGAETVNLNQLRLVKTLATERAKEKGAFKEGLTKSQGRGGCRMQQPPAKCILSAAQQLRIPEVFRKAPSETAAPCDLSVLSDASNHPAERRNGKAAEGHDCSRLPSLNQSYDVDAPSNLWYLEGSGSDLGLTSCPGQEKHRTPESGDGGQGGDSKVKRRLIMHTVAETRDGRADGSRGAGPAVRPNSSTPKAAAKGPEGQDGGDKQEELKLSHAARVRALQEEHRRQQEELMQALAVHYRLLQSVSLPRPTSGSRLGDTLTFPTLSQPSIALSEHYRPLLAAAVKGFLTRRLLRTGRVMQLVRTIRDTQQFLQALQQSSPGRAEFCSRQDILLQERVTLQLRAARYEVSDIFFSLSAGERMQLISWDRELARERELRRQSGHTGQPRGKSSLSAATQKSLERKREVMTQKKAVGRHRGVVAQTRHSTGVSAEQPQGTKRGQFRANPQRVPKSTYSSRPR